MVTGGLGMVMVEIVIKMILIHLHLEVDLKSITVQRLGLRVGKDGQETVMKAVVLQFLLMLTAPHILTHLLVLL